ncbi:MAG TPA: glyoxalase superfamily protein [Microlunatus sp.]|nr:glyoxalase superfamily protein [Microlunatus sp.]
MRVHRILANVRVSDLEEAKRFYADFLGLSHVAFDLGWVARVGSPDSSAELQLVTRDAEAAEDAVVSVLADDIDAAYDEALQRGYEIVHPLTTESWGVHRFLVRAPDGNVINIVEHPN